MNKDVLLPDEKNPLIWINPGRISGAPCFYQTRLPVDSLDEYLGAFGLAREQAVAVLEYAKNKTLKAAAKN
jgi:uncharacterized protein (DUF433 family)